jgi:two-component system, LytTR family, response regulator
VLPYPLYCQLFMKTNILVVDNEAPIRTSLCKLIAHFMADDAMIEEAGGVEEGLLKIGQFKPDILFLDIEMEDGTGFDLLQRVEQPGFELVFTTAHNQYAIQAFEFSALNYLLKPISPSALQRTLQRASANIRQKNIQQQLDILLAQLFNKPGADQKIALKDVNGTYFVRIADIIYCEADGPYTRFVIKGADDIVISKNLKEYETLLEAHRFIRCHHSYLVNTQRIMRFDKADGGLLLMEGGKDVPVSQRKKDQVMFYLENG